MFRHASPRTKLPVNNHLIASRERLTCTTGTGSLMGVKRPECGVDHQISSRADVKEEVEVYVYSPPDIRDLF